MDQGRVALFNGRIFDNMQKVGALDETEAAENI